MSDDYLETVVTQRMAAYLAGVAALARGAGPELVRVIPYFPLNPGSNGSLRQDAWPLIDGTLTIDEPRSISASSFSGAYAGFLSATTLVAGKGSASGLLRLAELQTTARGNTQSASAANGGASLEVAGQPAGGGPYVPAYGVTWADGLPSAPLSIKVDVWRKADGDPWQAGAGQGGGQRLKASLVYSDFRLAVVTPAPLFRDKGWYATELVEGMRTGAAGGVTFDRMSAFQDPKGFLRAQAFVIVGRVQFDMEQDSTIPLMGLYAAVNPVAGVLMPSAADLRMTPGGLEISRHLRIPVAPGLAGARRLKQGRTSTSWDTGDLYGTLDAGFILGVARQAPLLPFTAPGGVAAAT